MQKNSLKRNAFWSILSNTINILLLFILTPIITNGLGDTGYGIYVILATIGGALSIMNLGLGEATLRYVAFYHARADKVGVNRTFNSTLWLYTLLGGIISLLLSLFPNIIIAVLNLESLGNEGPLLIRLTLLLFFINFIAGCFGSVPQALQRYDIYSFLQTGQNLIRFASNILVILLGYGLKELITVNLYIGILTLLAYIIVSKKLLPYLQLYSRPSISDYREIFSYGLFAFIGQLVGLIWQYCDNILLSIFIGPKSVGYFSIPMQLIGKVNSLATSGFGVLFPKFASEKNRAETKALYIKSTQLSLYFSIIVFVPMALMIKDFLSLWISPAFAGQSGFIATLLTFSYIIRGAFLPYDSLLKGLGLPKYIMYITIASSLIILTTDLILIPKLGINGVGFAYILSSIAGIIAVGIIWKRFICQKSQLAYKLFVMPYFISVCSFSALYFIKDSIKYDITIYSFLIIGTLAFAINTCIVTTFIHYCSDKTILTAINTQLIPILKERCNLRKK